MIALSVAAALAIFVVYTALAGNGVANLTPSTVAGHTGNVSLVGKVVGKPQGNAYTAAACASSSRTSTMGRRRASRSCTTAPCPTSSRPGRDLVVEGALLNGVFVAKRGSMITKCPRPLRAGEVLEDLA